jgi:hypothetical protein
MKYTYVIYRTVVQAARVDIEADSEAAADTKARRIADLSSSTRCPVQLNWWVDESLAEGYTLVATK